MSELDTGADLDRHERSAHHRTGLSRLAPTLVLAATGPEMSVRTRWASSSGSAAWRDGPLLDTQPDFTVLGTACDGAQAGIGATANRISELTSRAGPLWPALLA